MLNIGENDVSYFSIKLKINYVKNISRTKFY